MEKFWNKEVERNLIISSRQKIQAFVDLQCRELSLKSMYIDRQTEHQCHQPASIQCMIQHFSRFELRMGKTLPEKIVFKVRKLP